MCQAGRAQAPAPPPPGAGREGAAGTRGAIPGIDPEESAMNLKAKLQPIRRRIGVRFVVDRDPDHRKTIFVAGTGRSAKTWVGDIINHRNEYRTIFEPFHPKNVARVEPFGGRRYMRPFEQNPQLLDIARFIVTGRIRHRWTERFNRRFVCNERIITAAYASLMLKWLHTNFPGMPMVLHLRHPCAIAASFVRHGYRGAVEPLLEQENLVEDFLAPYRSEIEGAKDVFERTVFLACIEMLVPLRQFSPDEIYVTFYENLVRDPETEIGRLFAHLGKEFDPADLPKMNMPSLTARRSSSAVWTGEDRAAAWRKHVTDDQMRRAVEIFEMFGLDGIYSDAPMPCPEAAFEIMRSAAAARPAPPPAPEPTALP
jgi:hypothetical protein